MRKLDARQLAREKSLFRYSSALERADFSAVAAVLQEAERDPVLAQMITEINMVYESETFRPSPSLNHSSNHQKDLLMTTIVLNNRQRPMQRWLPITLAAACVSVLFIGALMLRPIRPINTQAGIQGKVSATPTAAATATIIPSPTAAVAAQVVEVTALLPTIVPPDVQFSTSAVGTPVCRGTKIITEDTIVHAQPSEKSTAVWRIPSGTQAETLVTGFGIDDSSTGTNSYWFFIKADVNGDSVQGWVSARVAQPSDPASPCPANEVAAASGVLVPATVVPMAAEPVFSIAVPSVCNSAITVEGTTLHVINQVDKAAAIFAAPLTINSDAPVVGEFAAKSDAVLLYQQYDQQSAPVGALWYLIMTNGEGDKQVTGWVSANSITAADGCADAGTVNVTAATISPAQLEPITGVAVTGSTQTGTCHIFNMTGQPATVFAAPLTTDSNALVIGTLPAQSGAVVIYQSFDRQSAPIGALWYLIKTNGVNTTPVMGWISATSINATNSCAPEQLTGVSLETAGVASGTISALPMPVPDVAISAQTSRCSVVNQTAQSATVYAKPLTADSNAAVVGEFLPQSEAVIITQNYDSQSDPNGALWYMITTIGDKSVTGWVSASTINTWMKCTPEGANADATTAVIPLVEVGGGTVTTAPDTAPLGICHVVNPQRDSVPVFSGPSSKGDEATLVNNLTPNVPATVLYQQQNKQTGEVWYLVIAVMDQGKQISGWVSADSVKVVDRCPVVS